LIDWYQLKARMRHSNFNTLINPKHATTKFGLKKLETPTDLYINILQIAYILFMPYHIM